MSNNMCPRTDQTLGAHLLKLQRVWENSRALINFFIFGETFHKSDWNYTVTVFPPISTMLKGFLKTLRGSSNPPPSPINESWGLPFIKTHCDIKYALSQTSASHRCQLRTRAFVFERHGQGHLKLQIDPTLVVPLSPLSSLCLKQSPCRFVSTILI